MNQATPPVVPKAVNSAPNGISCPDVYKCPSAASVTHTAAKAAARKARIGDRASVMVRTCCHPDRARGRSQKPPIRLAANFSFRCARRRAESVP